MFVKLANMSEEAIAKSGGLQLQAPKKWPPPKNGICPRLKSPKLDYVMQIQILCSKLLPEQFI